MVDLTIIEGHAIDQMRALPAESVHLIVTSPPYWGLRDYKIPPSIWGGDSSCDHDFVDKTVKRENRRGLGLATSEASIRGGGKKAAKVGWQEFTSGFCSKCGAWRGAFGLEPSPHLYIEHAVLIFREAWRVLRNDGTLWLNLGDSFCPGGGDRRDHGNGFNSIVGPSADAAMPRGGRMEQNRQLKSAGLKAGDLVGIPWRIALALQADGWYLRRDNIWFKPNPMPESVSGWRWEQHRIKVKSCPVARRGLNGNTQSEIETNAAEYVACTGCDKCAPNDGLILRRGNWRCTTSHEYVFQFSKSANYFCDAEAAREKTSGTAHDRGHGVNPKAKQSGRNSRMKKDQDPGHQTPGRIHAKQNRSFSAAVNGLVTNRNLRSVWKIPTRAYRGAHFATFPPALVRPIIKAASPLRCCRGCGAPFAPVVKRGEADRAQQRACGGDSNGEYFGTATKEFALHGAQNASAVKARILAGMVAKEVIGYRPTCSCPDTGDFGVPAVILDPFAGSGTVGEVGQELGRAVILIEISAAYVPLIRRRCEVMTPLL